MSTEIRIIVIKIIITSKLDSNLDSLLTNNFIIINYYFAFLHNLMAIKTDYIVKID